MLRWESLLLLFLTVAHSKEASRASRGNQGEKDRDDAWDFERAIPTPHSSKPVITTTPRLPVTTQAPAPGYPFPAPFPHPNPLPIYPAPQPNPIQPYNPFNPYPSDDHYATAPNGHLPSIGHPVQGPPRTAYGQGFKRVTCRCCCREETITPRFRVHCHQPTPQPPCDCRCATRCGSTGGCNTPNYPIAPIGPSDCGRRLFDPDCNRVPTQYGGQPVEIPPFLNSEGLPDQQPEYPLGSEPYPTAATTFPIQTTTKSSSTVALTAALALLIAKGLFA
ncbi:unnamed protein product, partial [Mesorhabditis belari]|uniref:Uncharacterized protein n=1 Tax=Mesorhabditis belari TaxID=2138241 RepID=A0AAF3F4Z4_9BILA